MLASECSSECESGWTLYFEHSMNPSRRNRSFLSDSFQKDTDYCKNQQQEVEEEEEEDMSMVSDASSGPPHLHDDNIEEEDATYFNNGICHSLYPKTDHYSTCAKPSKSPQHEQQPSLLDDTASSPMMKKDYSYRDMPMESFLLPDPSSHGNYSSQEISSAFQFGAFQADPLPSRQVQEHYNQWF